MCLNCSLLSKANFFHIHVPVKCWLTLGLGQQLNVFIKTEKKECGADSLDASHKTAHADGP